ncbi:MAG TPA: hypothetical protein VD865_09465 [Stenotrophomonas sp.]|nr:hypothetical protein [Stenotrophomonas sp.]
MADHHQRALIAAQGLFELRDRGQVQVVGWFVEQQQLGCRLGMQQAGQGRAQALATG